MPRPLPADDRAPRWVAAREERDEAARLIAERGYAVLWTPAHGRRTVATLAAWDALAARPKPRAAG